MAERPRSSGTVSRGALAAWGRTAARHPWRVIGAWLLLLVVLAVVGRSLHGRYTNDFSIGGTESQSARDLLEARFPQQAGDAATIVFDAPQGIASAPVRSQVEALLGRVAKLPGVVGVSSPYDNPAAFVSRDGRIAYATAQYATRASTVAPESIDALFAAVDAANAPAQGLRVEVGGPVAQAGEQTPPGRSEIIGLVAAAVVLMLAFGSVVAAGMPIVTALFGLGSGILLIGLLTRVLPMSQFTPAFASMIGLGVGIDYSLFILTRFREEVGRGAPVPDAAGVALNTAGRAVIFAGVAVAIALLGLFVVGIKFIAALGLAGSAVVLASVLVATTLLPALLGLVGPRIDRWSIAALQSTDSADPRSIWYRTADRIQRRPLVAALVALTVLLLLAMPALRLRLGSADAGNDPTSLHTRRAYDLLSQGFGPGFNGPLLLAVDLPAGAGEAALASLVQAIGATPDVAAVTPPRLNAAGDAAIITVFPKSAPQDAATSALTHVLRDRVIPQATRGTAVQVYVGGITAAFEDIGTLISARLPYFFALVIGLSCVLLMVVFRSIAVPLKAAVMNLLSIGAAYGVVVAIFQWGWLGPLLHTGRPGPIESFLPMMLFAILFGLSMDYEVFLLSRIREEYVHGRTNREAVTRGLSQTARVITAAASIMVAVFLSFAFGDSRVIKEFGVGLGTAILVDATIVRIVLVPSVMALLGDANWWMPRWLDRLLPRLQIEGPSAVDDEAPILAGGR